MSRPAVISIPQTSTYDNCLILSCLKRMFTRTKEKTTEPEIVVTNSIADIKDRLAEIKGNNTLELSYDYLQAMETSMPATDFRYVVIYREQSPVLFCYFQVVSLTSRNFSFEKNNSCVKSIFRFFLDLRKIKVLISGNAVRNDTAGYVYNTSLLTDDEAIEIIASAAEKVADEERVTATIIKDTTFSPNVKKWLSGLGYFTPWSDHVMNMAVDERWASINDYTASLSRKYKARGNKILAAKEGLDIRSLSAEEIRQQQGSIYKLFINVAQSQPFVLTEVSADHFAMLKDVYGSAFELIGYYKDNKMVAFYTAITTYTAYELYYVGMDYKSNAEYQLYFNILFSGLEQAIRYGKKELRLGRTSFDAKASLGAKAVTTDYMIKTAHVPGAAVTWFADYFSAMEDGKWKQRNPFK